MEYNNSSRTYYCWLKTTLNPRVITTNNNSFIFDVK